MDLKVSHIDELQSIRKMKFINKTYNLADIRKDFLFSIDEENYLVIEVPEEKIFIKADEVNKCSLEAAVDHSAKSYNAEGTLIIIETEDAHYSFEFPFRDIQDAAIACMNIVCTCRLKRS